MRTGMLPGTEFTCMCCGTTQKPPSGVLSEDLIVLCAECEARGRERVGFDFDRAELGGEG
jgi:hypothetical protein